MVTAFFSALRLIWPFIRELLFKDNGVKHSIEKNQDYAILFALYLGMFALSLFAIDHAIRNHRYYTDKLNAAAISLERSASAQQLLSESRDEVKRLRNRNESLEDDLRKSNELVQVLLQKVDPRKAEDLLSKELQRADTPGQRRTVRERLKDLRQKYDEGS